MRLLAAVLVLVVVIAARKGDVLVHLRNWRDGLHRVLLPAVADGQSFEGDSGRCNLRSGLLPPADGDPVRVHDPSDPAVSVEFPLV